MLLVFLTFLTFLLRFVRDDCHPFNMGACVRVFDVFFFGWGGLPDQHGCVISAF